MSRLLNHYAQRTGPRVPFTTWAVKLVVLSPGPLLRNIYKKERNTEASKLFYD